MDSLYAAVSRFGIAASILLACGLTQICSASPSSSEKQAVNKAAAAIDDCYHWAGESGDQSPERNKDISKGIERDCPVAERKARKAYKRYPKNALLISKILQLMSIGRFKTTPDEKTNICDAASSAAGADFRRSNQEDAVFRDVCPEQGRKLYGK